MLNYFVPYLNVKSIYDIDLQQLKDSGVQGIITDLDNTLVGAKEPLATPRLIEWIKLVQTLGFNVVIVSNNSQLRVANFAQPLSLPFIYKARKPTNRAFAKAIRIMKLRPEQTVVIGDQMLTDVLGGNRMGLKTILVTPISPKDEGWATRINRKIEKFILKRLKKAGMMQWEDQS